MIVRAWSLQRGTSIRQRFPSKAEKYTAYSDWHPDVLHLYMPLLSVNTRLAEASFLRFLPAAVDHLASTNWGVPEASPGAANDSNRVAFRGVPAAIGVVLPFPAAIAVSAASR
jgi:hypothetical protein